MHNSKLILVLPTNRVGLVLEALNGEFSELSVIPCDNTTIKIVRKNKFRTNLSDREVAVLNLIKENPAIGLTALETKYANLGFHGPSASPTLTRLIRLKKIRY